MTQPAYKFYLIGLSIAALEEFITQGVLKDDLDAWITPTIIAFVPFLVVARLLGVFLDRALAKWQVTLVYYLTAGGIGLLFEWFVIGLAPWRDPNPLEIPFQLGMFSFWGTVALGPRLLLDRQAAVASVQRWYGRFLLLALVVVYGAVLSASHETRFLAGIVSVIGSFLLLNCFYVAYVWTLKASDPLG